MKRTAIAITLICACSAFGANKQLTNDEIESALRLSYNYMMATLKVPSTAHISVADPLALAVKPINFWGKPAIQVDLTVEAQNSFGAMLRSAFTCKVKNDKVMFCYER